MGSLKILLMFGLMYGVRQLDSTDPNIIYLLRALYGCVHAIIITIVVYVYLSIQKAVSTNDKKAKELIYVPTIPESPFAGLHPDAGAANEGKTYKQIEYGVHALATARSLIFTTIMGICVTCGVHMYKGMVIGLAMQIVMGPINLLENILVSTFLFPKKDSEEVRLFKEKKRHELTDKDKIEDETGNKILLPKIKAPPTKPVIKLSKKDKIFEELLLDVWDLANDERIAKLMEALNQGNINYRTSESGWTPTMIMSGIGTKDKKSALLRMKKLGANPEIIDKDGWNCMHWAAFHGSEEGVKLLLEEYGNLNLHLIKDKEGLSPLDYAKSEGNNAVAKILEGISTCVEEKLDGLKSRK